MKDARLELKGLAKRFGPVIAVFPTDLSVRAGELLVILGPSGCGKTTTLRMAAGLERPTQGQVLIDGQDVTRMRPGARDVAFVFQMFSLYPHLSVEENVAFPLRAQGLASADALRRAAAMLKRLGLSALARSQPRTLSGGDQQRVGLARALVRNPHAFLMDEPLGTLDGAMREETRETLRAIQTEAGSTTVFVTHDQEEAMGLADRIAVMREGKIVQLDHPRTIYDSPANLFVAHFVGSPGMNVLRGVRRGETIALEGLGLRARVAEDGEPGLGQGRECYLGVRPENVLLSETGAPCVVEHTEIMGSHNLLELRLGEGFLKAWTALENPAQSPQLHPLDTVRIFGRYDLESSPTIWLSGEVRRPGSYRTSGQMHLRDAIYAAGGVKPNASLGSAQVFRSRGDGSVEILSVNLAAALRADPLNDVLVQPQDRIIVHRSLYRVDPPSVYIRGEVANPGRYPLGDNMQVADLLAAAGGARRSADLQRCDLTHYDVLPSAQSTPDHRRINLTASVGDAYPDIPLKDGDVLSVPERPGWKDLGASITLKGEVRNPGVYGIRPGERLSSVLKRAGGLLPTAYPQGAIFTRPSVRDLQEKSKQDLIQRMELETATVKTSLSTTGSEQVALAQAAAAQQQRVLEALRKSPSPGRLVIQMRSDLKGFDNSSQDVELRDGDVLEIPKRPSMVLIVGQVYNTNAIAYTLNKNAGWYLSQAGGATRLADKHAIFIVHANGEITSNTQKGWWSRNIMEYPVRPGDTVVVPERPVIGDTRWRNLIAVAQVAEAAAITAAVIP